MDAASNTPLVNLCTALQRASKEKTVSDYAQSLNNTLKASEMKAIDINDIGKESEDILKSSSQISQDQLKAIHDALDTLQQLTANEQSSLTDRLAYNRTSAMNRFGRWLAAGRANIAVRVIAGIFTFPVALAALGMRSGADRERTDLESRQKWLESVSTSIGDVFKRIHREYEFNQTTTNSIREGWSVQNGLPNFDSVQSIFQANHYRTTELTEAFDAYWQTTLGQIESDVTLSIASADLSTLESRLPKALREEKLSELNTALLTRLINATNSYSDRTVVQKRVIIDAVRSYPIAVDDAKYQEFSAAKGRLQNRVLEDFSSDTYSRLDFFANLALIQSVRQTFPEQAANADLARAEAELTTWQNFLFENGPWPTENQFDSLNAHLGISTDLANTIVVNRLHIMLGFNRFWKLPSTSQARLLATVSNTSWLQAQLPESAVRRAEWEQLLNLNTDMRQFLDLSSAQKTIVLHLIEAVELGRITKPEGFDDVYQVAKNQLLEQLKVRSFVSAEERKKQELVGYIRHEAFSEERELVQGLKKAQSASYLASHHEQLDELLYRDLDYIRHGGYRISQEIIDRIDIFIEFTRDPPLLDPHTFTPRWSEVREVSELIWDEHFTERHPEQQEGLIAIAECYFGDNSKPDPKTIAGVFYATAQDRIAALKKERTDWRMYLNKIENVLQLPHEERLICLTEIHGRYTDMLLNGKQGPAKEIEMALKTLCARLRKSLEFNSYSQLSHQERDLLLELFNHEIFQNNEQLLAFARQRREQLDRIEIYVQPMQEWGSLAHNGQLALLTSLHRVDKDEGGITTQAFDEALDGICKNVKERLRQFSSINESEQNELLALCEQPMLRRNAELEQLVLPLELDRIAMLPAHEREQMGWEIARKELRLRDLGTSSALPPNEEIDSWRHAEIQMRRVVDVPGGVLIPPGPDVDYEGILTTAMERVSPRLPAFIQDDMLQYSLDRVKKGLREKLDWVKSNSDEWKGSADPLRHWAHSLDQRQQEIDQSPGGADRSRRQEALDQEIIQVMRDQLGPGVLHCSDRLYQAASQVYTERVAGQIANEAIDVKVRRRALANIKDTFLAVATEVATSISEDPATFAQVAYDELAERVGLLKDTAGESPYGRFTYSVQQQSQSIMANFRTANTAENLADSLKDLVTYDDFSQFMEGRFKGLMQETSAEDTPVGQETYKIDDFLQADRTKPNTRGMLLMLYELGIIVPPSPNMPASSNGRR